MLPLTGVEVRILSNTIRSMTGMGSYLVGE